MLPKIKVKSLKPFKLAYLEYVGRYDQVPYDKAVPRLYEWAKEKHVRPGWKNINVFFDDPEEVAPEKCKSWVGIPVKGEVASDEEVSIAEMSEMEVACMKFHGPNEQFKAAYGEMGAWVEENGYEWAGPCMEVYTKKPKRVDGVMMYSYTIQIPIKKK